jgi:hypothetical protein
LQEKPHLALRHPYSFGRPLDDRNGSKTGFQDFFYSGIEIFGRACIRMQERMSLDGQSEEREKKRSASGYLDS